MKRTQAFYKPKGKRARYTPLAQPLAVRMPPYTPRRELNLVDTGIATYAMNTTGSIALLTTIAQGVAQNQRVGRKIQVRSIQVRGNIKADSATTTTRGTWMIVYDKRPTGSLPAITDILESANSVAFTNSTNVGRFQIVCRKDYSIIGNDTTAGQQTDKTHYAVDKFIKLNKPVVYKAAATGAIADIEQGAFYIVTVGSSAAGTGDADCVIAFRVRFIDN